MPEVKVKRVQVTTERVGTAAAAALGVLGARLIDVIEEAEDDRTATLVYEGGAGDLDVELAKRGLVRLLPDDEPGT